MHAFQWRHASLVARQRHHLTISLDFSGELVMMLERAGFTEVEVRAEYKERRHPRTFTFLVYVAALEWRDLLSPGPSRITALAAVSESPWEGRTDARNVGLRR